jgi:hypothetical protein
LKYKIQTSSSSSPTVFLEGDITEDAKWHFESLQEDLSPYTSIAFDFEKVRFINSLGVKNWVLFLRTLEAHISPISFKKCPPFIIHHINMIPSFKGQARIESFYVTYLCPKCRETTRHLFFVPKDINPVTKRPNPPKCHKEGALLESEELEDEYFQFLEY